MTSLPRFSRVFSLVSLCALSLGVVSLDTMSAQAQRISSIGYIGQATFDAAAPVKVSTHTNGTNDTTTVGGLSGITRDAARGVYYAISDDRGNLARPGENINPRFYTMNINTGRTVSGQAAFGNSDIVFSSYTTLLRANGTPYPFENTATTSDVDIDPEDILLAPDGNSVYIATEGDKARSTGGVMVNNFIANYSLGTGQITGNLPIPTAYQITDTANTTSGPRNNLAFESLTRNGNTLLTGVENALQQDGAINSTAGGTFTRLLSYDLTTNLAATEYRYNLDATVEGSAVFSTSGLCALLSLGDDQYLALERSFAVGGTRGGGLKADGTTAAATGYAVKLYQFSLKNVAANGFVNKELVLDLNTLGIALDNLEGMTLGPKLADGRTSLLLVSDDNFTATNGNGTGSAGQFTQFVSLGIAQTTVPEPAPLVLIGAGLPVLGALVLRRRK